MESDSASYPEWKIVFPPHHPKEFPGLSNIDAFVVPEVFSLLSTILKVQFCPKKSWLSASLCSSWIFWQMLEVWNSVCFLRVLPFKKSVNDRRREGEKKVSCHMLELFFKKCGWENAFWAAAKAASSRIYLHGHNSVVFEARLRSCGMKAALLSSCVTIDAPPYNIFFLLLLCLLSLLLLRPELSFFSLC